jgi:hypothetical protein
MHASDQESDSRDVVHLRESRREPVPCRCLDVGRTPNRHVALGRGPALARRPPHPPNCGSSSRRCFGTCPTSSCWAARAPALELLPRHQAHAGRVPPAESGAVASPTSPSHSAARSGRSRRACVVTADHEATGRHDAEQLHVGVADPMPSSSRSPTGRAPTPSVPPGGSIPSHRGQRQIAIDSRPGPDRTTTCATSWLPRGESARPNSTAMSRTSSRPVTTTS